jgi:hypothetical protein
MLGERCVNGVSGGRAVIFQTSQTFWSVLCGTVMMRAEVDVVDEADGGWNRQCLRDENVGWHLLMTMVKERSDECKD